MEQSLDAIDEEVEMSPEGMLKKGLTKMEIGFHEKIEGATVDHTA